MTCSTNMHSTSSTGDTSGRAKLKVGRSSRLGMLVRPTRLALLLVLTFAAAWPSMSLAREIDFIEDFTLAKDRAAALKQLIPGTSDYYYYHCLHLQNTEQFDKVEDLLKLWIKRHNYSTRVWEIKNRQALLTYDKNPAASLEYIRQRLNIRFNHQRESLGKEKNLPLTLNQDLISRTTLTKIAKSRYSNLNGFEESALDWLVGTQLNPARRRHLLQRLQRPDYPNLPKLIVDDLKYKYSRGFGSMNIHKHLLPEQLAACLKLKPDLLNQTNFVNIYISKLMPNSDVDAKHDPKVRQAYLERLWTFVSRLAPVHNSLKAHVLYQRLVFDRALGIYDKNRFMTYIKLPRRASYVEPKYLARVDMRKYPVNLNANYSSVTQLPIIGNDEKLIRSYLHHFFVKETTYKPYTDYIRDTYLKQQFAETKIVNGLGDPEQWYSLLSPAAYQALKQRIDLDFAHTNKKIYGTDEAVSLDLYTKNVKTLLVKVFHINAANYYRDHRRQLNTDINLDGLVANLEKTHQYDLPPVRRAKRHFEFANLNKPGLYVIDFIGNGRSSRMLVRKGRLRHLVRLSTAGHIVTVLDDKSRKLADASVYLGGTQHRADKDGEITIPFSNKPGRQSIIMTAAGLTTLAQLNQYGESYKLQAGFYVDRESLLKRKTAKLLVRPGLYLSGQPVTLKVLEQIKLVIHSTDQDGVNTSKEVPNFKLFEDRESVYEFQVPQRLRQISFSLSAKVQNLSQNKKMDLITGQSFKLNEIDRTEKTEDLHLANFAGSYAVELLGKTGEPRVGRSVQIGLKHRDFKTTVILSFQSDAKGRVTLGALKDIDWVAAKGPQGTAHRWTLLTDKHTYSESIHAKAGESITVPYTGIAKDTQREEISFLEKRGVTYVADRWVHVAVKNGMVTLGKLPRGDYDLLLKRANKRIKVRVTDGAENNGYVLGENRYLEVRNDTPLQIASITSDKESVIVALSNANKFTRVHVFATRYHPEYSAFNNFDNVYDREPLRVSIPKFLSSQIEGRNIGDEYRYILDRKYAKKYPGNMLKRPSLLLNPWAIRSTDTGQQLAKKGNAFGAATGNDAPFASSLYGSGGNARRSSQLPSNLDFLGQASVALTNLVADDKGIITIKREDLGAHQQIHVVAVDPDNTAYRVTALPEVKANFIDLRLINGLDPKIHYTEQKQIDIVAKASEFKLPDITTSQFEAYDSLPRVYALYATLNPNANLIEFSFILNWPNLKPAEKQDKYSKYACHELNFFIFKKDQPFFNQVVKPYLANKKDKTFLDRWLLGQDLSSDLKPWEYEQLNIVERILLAQQIKGEQQYTSRHVNDLYDLIPPNIDRFNHLFKTALKGRALDTGDGWGMEDALDEAAPVKHLAERLNEYKNAPGEATTESAAATSGRSNRTRGSNKNGALGLSSSLKKLEARQKSDKSADKKAAPAPPRVAKPVTKTSGKRRTLADMEKGEKEEAYFDKDESKRNSTRQYYRKLDKTKEWVENNYYHLAIAQQNASLVRVNSFWNDFARHDKAKPFYSTNLAEASGNFPEMMFALSVLDLPFTPAKHQSKFDKAQMSLTPGSDIIIFHKQIKPAKQLAKKTPILVSQNFFNHGDRYKYINNERMDKYVTDEFIVHTVYGCQVVITNPTSTPQKLDLLLQVPVGALSVLNGKATRSIHLNLQPYNTHRAEYYFYFPAAGQYAHYPVHVAKDEQVVAFAQPSTLKVVNQPSKIDKESWNYISQFGSAEQVIGYMKANNLNRTNLEKIAWRMRDKAFFGQVTALLGQRHVYNNTLWSYGIHHNTLPSVRQYLAHANGFVNQVGTYIDSKPLTINPVVRKLYEQMDYAPLVNARAHALGNRRQILNTRFYGQYHRLLKIGAYKRQLDDHDLMAITYYMLLQDRIDEALNTFKQVNAANLPTKLQYDYFTAYLDLYSDEPAIARATADRYANYPVDRWRNHFRALATQLDEVQGKDAKIVDKEDRGQQQTKLAATQGNFEFKVEAKKININYQNLKKVKINYYLMDVELLFSRNPFVQGGSGQFAYIKPNATATVTLPAKKTKHSFDLPKQYHNANVLVEIIAADGAAGSSGLIKSQAYYSHTLNMQVVENYGQLRIAHQETNKPVAKTYVKVYALLRDGRVKFYKDGYTDRRGRFDYTSLNTNELEIVRKFALLVYSDEFGAVVREATPPKR